MYLVRKINYIDGYKISLTFNNHNIKIVDVEPYLDKGIFLALKDPKYFNKVALKGHTIVWPNGADFCSDVLYEIGEAAQSESASKKGSSRKKSRITHQVSYAMSRKRLKKPKN